MNYKSVGTVCTAQEFIAARVLFLVLDGEESSHDYVALEDKANFIHLESRCLMKRAYGIPSPISVIDRGFIESDLETLRKSGE